MKEKRFKVAPNRWREGLVHRYVYDDLNDEWYIPCRGIATFRTKGTVIDDPSVPVECKHCPNSL